ncbi:MAG: branched-chain amino acid transaminase [Chloroflexi bacterium]|nr:branched-chain amino acid transaminase [Chloroflexota bacterium]
MGFHADVIWLDGEFVPWEKAQVHVLSHALHYGSSVFEGIRCYETKAGSAVFCLPEHVKRLFNSCKVYRMELKYTQAQVSQAIVDTIKQNKLRSCYIRPLAFRGYGQLGVEPRTCPMQLAIATWPWGAYLGADALEQGVDVGVSSWRRAAPDTFPAGAKAAGNYLSSQLIKMEAVENGYAEGIALDVFGNVAEGSGENIFLVKDGVLFSPPLANSVLPGITRASVLTLARDLGITAQETVIPREQLYMADELFFAGTAAELTPIRSVDHIKVGEGRRGPLTAKLQQAFFQVVSGQSPDSHLWLTPII